MLAWSLLLGFDLSVWRVLLLWLRDAMIAARRLAARSGKRMAGHPPFDFVGGRIAERLWLRTKTPATPTMPLPSWGDLGSLPVGEGSLVEEYLFWFALASLLKPKALLEIGTSFGVGALMLVWGASLFCDETRLTTIDVEDKPGRTTNWSKQPKLRRKIRFLQGDSIQMLTQLMGERSRFDLGLLDGCHQIDHVRQEWRIASALCDTWIVHDAQQFVDTGRFLNEIASAGYEVFRLRYPHGHQVHDDVSGGVIYRGLYSQSSLPWTASPEGPGMALVRRR